MLAKWQDKLKKREEEGTMRSLFRLENKLDFYSNDYLGMSSLDIRSEAKGGSTGSRLISGNSKEAAECESFLADWFKTESALVFNSGYDANLGFFSSIPQKGDWVLYDEKIHASVRDGIRLSFANSFSFIHNDVTDLQKKIQKAEGAVFVVVESLYSMDGDFAPLGEIAAICKLTNAKLVVDEAHACGVFGEHGRGIVDCLPDSNSVFARIVTFGKAYGYQGAAVLCSAELKQFLINFARSFIYTTALPRESYRQIQERVRHDIIPQRQRQLQWNISEFRSQFPENTFVSEVNSPIQVMRIGNIEETKGKEQEFLDKGWAVKAILSPTVAKGEEGIRFCIHF
ncbi:aminotransferase class I/II-fold pyridoxal phosphate-dependent enzyme [Crocinitomicaceae bacterium]|jgi:8-amino-7-oxononanoate synthase|nr:aminotransferase class I/II-fold pyridoxal phosphate-dependent enzyme [Crocinitomicaceae bacterium]MDG1347558.1 aminotransferase class I/II-fold pyridoxal phosphate-dependent enzyme [Crocinitomicaceae bacterium]MDG2465327.1 aminotransferase class I/II-fold pyridoxal phosphate-dependent enzyme [Crocinitomicaceae bacterium]